MTPPDLDDPASGNVWELLKAGRKLRGLGEKDLYRLLRWGPMAVADLVAEWFETELLRGTIAAQGIFGTFLGPWSAGSAATYLLRDSHGRQSRRSRHPTLWEARARLPLLWRLRLWKPAPRFAHLPKWSASRSRMASLLESFWRTGTRLRPGAVISNADPKRTLLGLVEPQHLEPGFLQKLQHYRMNGTVAKVNLALGGLPKFKGERRCGSFVGQNPDFAGDRLSGTRLRCFEVWRILTASVH